MIDSLCGGGSAVNDFEFRRSVSEASLVGSGCPYGSARWFRPAAGRWGKPHPTMPPARLAAGGGTYLTVAVKGSHLAQEVRAGLESAGLAVRPGSRPELVEVRRAHLVLVEPFCETIETCWGNSSRRLADLQRIAREGC